MFNVQNYIYNFIIFLQCRFNLFHCVRESERAGERISGDSFCLYWNDENDIQPGQTFDQNMLKL